MLKKIKYIDALRAAKNRASIADLLEIELKVLTYILYKQAVSEKYVEFSIDKKNGGSRLIKAPKNRLKILQRRLAVVLLECVEEIKSENPKYHFASHGFEIEKSIITNAKIHKNKKFVLNLDLQDFFPTITAKRIRGFFIKDKNFSLDPLVATTIAHIACASDNLPQGAPSSPVIANLITNILDVKLMGIAKKNGCNYTRYADDITFSTNKRDFPAEIAYRENKGHEWQLGRVLLRAIEKSGFLVNDKKTRMQYWSSRQVVTGLVVNDKVNVSSEYRKATRSYVHELVNKGCFYFIKKEKDEKGEVSLKKENGSVNQLHGILGFIHSIDNIERADAKKNPQNYINKNLYGSNVDKKLDIYRRFLFYTNFYTNESPLVVCEGKTDNVYISNAVHKLKSLFPELVKKDSDGQDQLSFKMLKYDRKHKRKNSYYLPNFSTVSILGAGSGGVPNLINMLKSYKLELRKFKAPKGNNPVVFVVDNDSEGRRFFSACKTNSDPKINNIDGAESYINIFENVYLVPIPAVKVGDSSIEDLFEESDIPSHIDGKRLVFSNDNDSTLAGKSDFAFKYVNVKSDYMNWTGFEPLIKNIRDAMQHHWNKS